MRKIILPLLIFMVSFLNAQVINIPDANFKAKLLELSIDTDDNGLIEVSEALQVQNLNLGSSNISSLEGIEFFVNLKKLYCHENQLSNLNVSELTNLEDLYCASNQLTSLDISGLTNLKSLDCSGNKLTSLSVSGLINLKYFFCIDNQLLNIDLLGLTKLEELHCSDNQLTSLDFSGLINLRSLGCYGNKLTSLELSELVNLVFLYCPDNQIVNLKVSGLVNLTNLVCSNNSLTSLNVSGLTNLIVLECNNNKITDLAFPELTNLKVLECSNNNFPSLNVSMLVNLTDLKCKNINLSSLDVSMLKNLGVLDCANNKLSSLDVSELTNLYFLDCSNNQLTSLDVSKLSKLITLVCSNNQFSDLVFSGLTSLKYLNCSNNQFTEIVFSELTNLEYLNCSNDNLLSLDVSSLKNLEMLECSNNKLVSLDVSGLNKLFMLECENNPFTVLNLKSGNSYWSDLNFSKNPNLEYVCVDDEDLALVQQKISEYGYANCHANSYCSFAPGGKFYLINGSCKIDANTNGCDVSDSLCSNLRFSVANGEGTGIIISNASGNYAIPVQAGTHLVTPQLENPTYFTVFPTNFTASFPAQASPLVQNICITPNGVHSDLEIKIIPINVARPGFDAIYEVFYRNKGTQVETPVINFNFNDGLMDYVSTTVTPNLQTTGLLTWNIGVLQSFMSGSFKVTFRINKPTDTPSVNGGDLLVYTASINDVAFTDEIVNDNVFTLNQTVVNSFDPNDITCLEGKIVNPSEIGEYVHYLIRFENTGTFSAANIVVKDVIDIFKFDVNSLQIVKASHDCFARIKGNQVEFVFENINLPFDDANNDGYVVLKIKSLPILTSGSMISNSANIYFDYNFPIATNTTTTTYQALSNQDFVFESEFKLYPNPAKNILNIQSKTGMEITSVEIYNTIGQLIMVAPEFKDCLDVAAIKTGTYFVKVNTVTGSATTKFVIE